MKTLNLKGNRTRSSLLMQTGFVILAFAVMVVASYYFLRGIERDHLEHQVNDTFSSIEALLKAELEEYETMHGMIAETLRGMLLMGMSQEVAEGYIRDINVYGHETAQLAGLMNVFAMFDVFDYAMFNPLYEDPATEFRGAPDFDPATRNWYIAAAAAKGRPVVTDIYRDFTSGRYTFTYTQEIYDNEGNRMAIVCLDVALDLLYRFSLDNRSNEGSFWTLHDKNHVVIAHPNLEFVGLHFREVNETLTMLADILEEKGSLTNYFTIDHTGRLASFSIKPTVNGWFLGIVVYMDSYYENLNTIILFLVALGVLLAGGLVFILIHLDRTLRRVSKTKESAEQSSRYKSAFLANMSHEIRTPMNAILGIAEIRMQDETLSNETEEALREIYDSGSLLLSIVNDILDLSKIEAGKLEIMPVKYDIPSLINDVVQINRLRYESKPIELILDVDAKTPLNMYGDELRIKQVMNNILSNAFKYTDEGEIRFGVYAEAKTENEVYLVFKVSDTGQGMTQEQLGQLFTEYMRFNLAANRTTVGTGLGLSITKQLVDMMHGEISVESQPGKGSVFTVRLPQEPVDALVCGSELTERLRDFRFQSSSMMKRSRLLRELMPYGSVLVVDDVESNLYVAKGMLMPYGLQVDTARSGFEALEKIKTGNVYDIVFMDHMMPKMDGIETMKKMRDMGYTRHIVALTANALVGHAEVFIESGFDGYLSKPVDSRELDHILNEFIRNKKQSGQVEEEQQQGHGAAAGGEVAIDMSEVEKMFVLDAQNAIDAFESMDELSGEFSDGDLDIYEITAHGIKSALLNVGETELSKLAYKLEEAAVEKNFDVIAQETPAFVEALKALLESKM